MVLCKYFQQGTCRFGNNCRFEHAYAGFGGGDAGQRKAPQQYNTQNYYTGKKPVPQKPGGLEIAEIIQFAQRELFQADKGGQWPLSTFAPLKDGPSFPGFEDYSPEEIRWLMYEALQSGKLEECKQHIKQLYESAKLRKTLILSPNAEIYSVLENLFRGPALTPSKFSFAQNENAAPNPFASAPSQTSVFGGSSVFGGPVNQQSSAATNNFSFATAATNIFGNSSGGTFSAPTVQQPSIFGQSTSPPTFHNTAPQQSIFGGSSAFGTASPSTASPHFSSAVAPNSGTFGASLNTPLLGSGGGGGFGTSVSTPATGVFVAEQTQPQSVFGGTLTEGFSSSATSTPFSGNVQQSKNSFQPAVSGSNLFSYPTQNTSVATGSSQEATLGNSVYSSKSELSESEYSCYVAQTFTMGKVPVKAPPRELCIS